MESITEVKDNKMNSLGLLPPLELSNTSNNNLKAPSSSARRGSVRLPSLGSIAEFEQELESPSLDSADSEFEESSQFSSSSRNSTEGFSNSKSPGGASTVVLEEREEKEIEKKVKQEFKQEFRSIKSQTREKQRILRKQFQAKINAARSKLLLARAYAERETIGKLQEEAERKEAEILNQRKRRRNSQIIQPHKTSISELYTVEEMAALRKVRAELDRARARRRSSIATSLVLSRHKGMKTGTSLGNDVELRRLEKEDEIKKIVEELENLGLRDVAQTLATTLENKVNSEEQLMENLKKERQNAKFKALVKKNVEVERLRREKLEEKELLERERLRREAEERERLERERRIRVMNALKRKAFNIHMRNNLTHATLTTKVSRAYTYSYFNTQR